MTGGGEPGRPGAGISRKRLDSPAVGRSAAFFDLDKTVIAKSSALAFGRPFYRDGLITRRDVVKAAYAQLMFRLGGTDEQTMARIRDYLADAVQGLAGRAGQPDRQRDAGRADQPVRLRRGGRPDRRAPGGRPRRRAGLGLRRRDGPADRRAARRHRHHRHPDGRHATAATPARSSSTPPARARSTGSSELAKERGYDLADSYAYSDSISDVPLLEARRPPHRGQPRPAAAPARRRERLAGARVPPPDPAGPPAARAPRRPGRRRRDRRRRGRRDRHRLVRPAPPRPSAATA